MLNLAKKNFNKLAFLSLGLAIYFFSSSCSSRTERSRIVVAGAGKISSLDPAQASTFHAIQLISALGDTLYKFNNDGSISPQLARDFPSKSADGKTIFIPLRDDVYFHDGTKLNSKSMAFTINRFIEIGTMNYLLKDLIKSVETPDEYTLKLNLLRPSSSLNKILTSINLTPLSEKAYKNYTNKFLNKEFIGTGPYKLSSFHSHQQNLIPFQKYWGGQVRNKGINFINLSNSTSLFSALITGEIDVLLSNSIDEDQRIYLNKLSKHKKLRKASSNALEIGYITLNTKSKIFEKSEIRKALLFSIDRDLISKRVSYGLRKPLRSLVPPILNNKKIFYWPEYNPSRTKSILKDAGFCKNKTLVIPLTFRSNVPTDKLLAMTWQEKIKNDLSECLSLKLNGVESTTVYKQLSQSAFDAVVLDWRAPYPDAEAYLAPFLSCEKIKGSICERGESVISGSFLGDQRINNHLQSINSLSGIERIKKLNQIEKYAVEGGAYLPIWLVDSSAWSQTNISKPEFNGNGELLLKNLERIN